MRFSPLAALVALSLCRAASAQLFINEIYFDPPSSGDSTQEYIELRGAPGVSLANTYLLIIENEDNVDGTGAAGQIDQVFPLGDKTLGPNGFLVLRQRQSPYTNIAPGAADYINTGSIPGWGTDPSNNSLGVSGTGTLIENSGFTAMLIRNDGDPITNAPTINFDLDTCQGVAPCNDGLDNPNGREGWTILDSIGVYSELNEALFGRTYAPVNFGVERVGDTIDTIDGTFTFEQPNIEPGAVYIGTGFELEYVARWGNSTGATDRDWHVSNLTNNPGSGYTSGVDFRQSATFNLPGDHPPSDGNPNTPAPQPGPGEILESSRGVPYGTQLLTTIGAPNYMTGDYNGDGVANAADYTAWRDSVGVLGTEFNQPRADANHDFRVDAADYNLWVGNYGAPPAPAVGPALTVPEPIAVCLSAIALGAATRRHRA